MAFELRNSHFEALRIAAPIGAGLRCPIVRQDYWCSFEEIFFTDEYRPVFELIPLPKRWIDIGCHAGFFSLFVVRSRRQRGLLDPSAALLVDGDSRVAESIHKICEQNNLGEQLQFLHGAIAREPGEIWFEEAVAMSSAVVKATNGAGAKRVTVARPEEMMKRLPPPYDLVKVDIEGAEYDFLASYGEILSRTRHLLLEWHSWHFGGGGVESIRTAAGAAGFREIMEVVPAHPVSVDASKSCGVILFENAK